MTRVTIDDVVLHATSVSNSGGWNTTSKQTEEGFEFTSYIRSEPIEASIEGWIPVEDYSTLQNLRDSAEPFPASIGELSIRRASLESLDISEEQGTSSHYKVSVTIKELRQASIETAEISIETESSGSMGTAAEDVEKSAAQPEGSNGGETEEETGGVAGTLAGIRESLSGVL
ncbi:hypothetical protein GWK26_12660 [haloarchaeon 3A1-DGR]|nr:hypothetical protein GWK26_12660 [haloarchaeon 3A1-DGR]